MRRDDIVDVPLPDDAVDSLRAWGWVSYLLHLIVAVAAVIPGAQASIALLLIAFIMDLVKRSDAAGTWQASHFRWRLWSVCGAGVLYLLSAPLFLLLYWPGALAWMVISVWFLYRIVKGALRMAAGRPVD